MHGAAALDQPHPRGVFRTRFKVRGVHALIAVDHTGEVKKRIFLTPNVDEVRATLWLRQWLDRTDPARPQLQLVHPTQPPRQLADLRHADPYGWEDHLAWALRMARNGRKLRRFGD